MLALAGEILSERQLRLLWDRFVSFIRTKTIPKKRLRSCQRKLRQPVSKWPRMIDPTHVTGPINITVLP